VANTLAYYDTATITAVKSFIVQAPGLEILQKPHPVIRWLPWKEEESKSLTWLINECMGKITVRLDQIEKYGNNAKFER
jgi:hypothetical protein